MKNFLMGVLLLSLLLFKSEGTCQANRLNYDFNPWQATRTISARESDLTEKDAIAFHSSYQHYKMDLLESNSVIFNNQIQEYLESILTKIAPDNQGKYTIVVTENPSPNAMALPDGTIICNIGLFMAMENEDQIAFILAHEIAHVNQNHGKKAYKKQLELEDKVRGQSLGKTFLYLQYNRESERQADADALRTLLKSSYNPHEASSALANLGDSGFFRLPDSTIFNLIGMDSTHISDGSLFFSDNEEALEAIDRSYHDAFLTHPDLDSRVKSTIEFLELMDEEKTSATPESTSGIEFLQIRKTAIKEVISKSYEGSEFGLSLFTTLHNYKEYANDHFFKTMIIKNLYWCCVYKQKDKMDFVLKEAAYLDYPAYVSFHQYLKNCETATLKSISHDLAKEWATSEGSDELFFYYALLSELSLGSEIAKILFDKYLMTYPDGKYTRMATQKAG